MANISISDLQDLNLVDLNDGAVKDIKGLGWPLVILVVALGLSQCSGTSSSGNSGSSSGDSGGGADYMAA